MRVSYIPLSVRRRLDLTDEYTFAAESLFLRILRMPLLTLTGPLAYMVFTYLFLTLLYLVFSPLPRRALALQPHPRSHHPPLFSPHASPRSAL